MSDIARRAFARGFEEALDEVDEVLDDLLDVYGMPWGNRISRHDARLAIAKLRQQ